MADREISSLPKLSKITEDVQFPAYVPGSSNPAQSASGAQFAEFAKESGKAAVTAEVNKAASHASSAEKSAQSAAVSEKSATQSAYRAEQNAANAQDAREAIENMEVRADTLGAGSEATVRKEVVNGVVRMTYGIPRGEQGAAGPKGEQGVQGPPGPQGPSGGAMIPISNGHFALRVDDDGHLILSYPDGTEPPDMYINEEGHLIMRF